MEKELDLYTATLDEIVFEDRNKAYGGYFLRVWYEKNVTKAVIFTCTAFVVIAASIRFYYNYTAEAEEVLVPVEIKMDLTEEPLKEEEIKKLPPPPPKVEQPKIEEVKFLPPVIKPDKEVVKEEQLKELDSLLTTNISDKDVEGDKIKKFDFDEGDEGGQIGGTGEEKTPEVVNFVSEQPRFKGTSTDAESDKAFAAFVKSRTIYPEDAKRQKIQGTVYVQFIISEVGKVTNVEVVKGKELSPSCDAEAIRVIKSMPDFSPPRQNGEPRKLKKISKISFNLSD
jgi:TonB family C-terminal domain